MLRQIEQKILQLHKATGIEIIFKPDDSLFISTFTTITRKNAIIKEKSCITITDINKLIEKIDTNTPLAVVLNGKGVLTRKLTSPVSIANPLPVILPGTNPDEFYYQVFENRHFSQISIIRKDQADKILNQLKNLGFKILSVSVGFSSLSSLLPFLLPPESKQAIAPSFVIHFNGGSEILDLKTTETNTIANAGTEYQIADQYIKGFELLPYAASISLLAEDLKTAPSLPSEMVVRQRENFRYYKLFRIGGLVLLAALFVILMTSFLFYNHYYTLNREMELSLPGNEQQHLQIQTVEKQIKQKEKFLDQSGWTTAGRTSYYADRIASLVPTDVLLVSMNVYPARSNSNGDINSLTYKKDTIQITGSCPDPVLLNRFTNGLKIIPDFREVIVKSYQYTREKETGLFSLEIVTK